MTTTLSLSVSAMKILDELRYGILAGSLASAVLILYATTASGGMGEAARPRDGEDFWASLLKLPGNLR